MPRCVVILKILLILQIGILAISCGNTQTTNQGSNPKPVVWNGSADISWYNEEEKEFIITTPEQLAGLFKLVSRGNSFSYRTIKLGADIMLNDTTNWKNWERKPPKNEWKPIGGFNGGIVNGFGSCCHPPTPGLLLDLPIALILYPIPDFIRRPLKLHQDEFNQFRGTFDGNGYTISGIYINSPKNYIGLFGAASDSEMHLINVAVTASYIKGGSNYTGGLVGNCRESTISNSYFSGTVIGTEFVGGLAGICDRIINSYSTGIVKGDSLVGGLAGASRATVNSYSTSIVSGDSSVGGLVGSKGSSITHSYFTSKVTGRVAVDHSYDVQTSNFTDWDFEATWGIDSAINNGYPYLRENNREKIAPRGSKDLSISTPQQLIEFAKMVNEGNDFKGKIVKLENDIMLNDTADWKNWDSVPPANKWLMIGSVYTNNKFSGTFDGNGKVISGVYRNYEGDRRGWQGFFNSLNSEGTIKNLGLVASYIKGGKGTGALVGVNNGNISNCYSVSTVSGMYNVGGLIGINNGDISNSYSVSTVTGMPHWGTSDQYVGGLVGVNKGTISDSYSAGTVESKGSFGRASGLIGDNAGAIIGSYYIGMEGAFKGWDFENVWGLDSTINNGHPYLRGF